MNINHSLLCLVMLASLSCATIDRASVKYDAPESVVYDPGTHAYFVSNYGGGTILKLSENGPPEPFITGLHKPLGLVINNRVLYVVNDLNRISGYSLDGGQKVFDVHIAQARFLNDLAFGFQKNLYVSDSLGNVIYQVDVSLGQYQLFKETAFNDPNGVYFDSRNKRLIVCQFKENAVIELISLNPELPSTVIETEFDNLDGIAQDRYGNYYVSAWGKGDFSNGFTQDGQIVRFDEHFRQQPTVVYQGYHGPADIFIDPSREELSVPLFFEQRIDRVTLESK